MIRIGDFARLAQVSIATLRHYDEIGLLKPVTVDAFTGYRYYSVGQLLRLHRILALKDLGFSLEQIDAVLHGLTLEHLRGMLQLRHAEVEQQIAQEQARLARIMARLRHIEREDTMVAYDVVLKMTAPLLVAACRVIIPTNDQAGTYLNAAYGDICSHVANSGAKRSGPNLAVWHQGAEVLSNEEVEVAVPIDRSISASERVQMYELPQQQVAAAVHYGAFEDFTQLHTAILAWTEANGYQISGPYRELYIQHNPDNLAESATEVQYPVARA